MIKNIILSVCLLITMTNTAMLYEEEDAAQKVIYEMHPTKPLTAQTIQSKITTESKPEDKKRCCMSFLKILEHHFSAASHKAPWHIQG